MPGKTKKEFQNAFRDKKMADKISGKYLIAAPFLL
jgi:hypothetical protein